MQVCKAALTKEEFQLDAAMDFFKVLYYGFLCGCSLWTDTGWG